MSININRVLLIGNLTRDPELSHTGGGMAVCTLGIAINGREKVGEEWHDRADFFDVIVWGNQGENCAQYLAKGSPVAVDGRLRQDRWDDRDTGQKRSKVKIVADTVQFLRDGKSDPEGSQRSDQAEYERPQVSNVDSDIPFQPTVMDSWL